jgi:hypothetical protein
MGVVDTNVSTTPLRQWGFRKSLPFTWTTLRGKHCRHPITVMGVVDTFWQRISEYFLNIFVFNLAHSGGVSAMSIRRNN